MLESGSIEDDRSATVQLDRAAYLLGAKDAIYGGSRRPGEGGQVFLAKRDRHRSVGLAQEVDKLHQAAQDPYLGGDEQRFEQPTVALADLLGQDREQDVGDAGMQSPGGNDGLIWPHRDAASLHAQGWGQF